MSKLQQLRIGDRVKVLQQDNYNNCFSKGDIVYVVGLTGPEDDYDSDGCPYYLSKNKRKKTGNYFGPYRDKYKQVCIDTVGGKLL